MRSQRTRGPGPVPGLSALVAVAGLLLAASSGRAEFLTAYTGNSQAADALAPNATIDGTYNFAVLDRTTGGVAGNVFGAVSDYSKSVGDPRRYAANFDTKFTPGTGSAGLDTSARYLYLFQIVNNGNSAAALRSIATYIGDRSLVTSFGYFAKGTSDVGGGDNRGAVSFSNDMGPDGGAFVPDAPVRTPTVKPSVVSIAPSGSNPYPGVVPVHLSLGSDGVLLTTFDDVSTLNGQLADKNRSVLIGFTSNDAPSLGVYRMYGGYNETPPYAQGHDFVPAPEPASLVMLGLGGLGLLGGGLVYRRRLRSHPSLA